ncbi:FAD-linked oxidoreductase-like protein [Globomyces pollinis-pini]|nr:FAD-linked oxidoreductase-like protein [Globomyces pollinis-pini]
MVSERELAMRLGYPSPIHPDIESTHAAYNAGVEFVIEQQAQYPRQNDSIKALALVVASHNNHSVDYTCGLMEKYGIPRSGGWVAFGQLMGMRDGTAYRLAGNGFKALKIVPYGPVEVAIAYLHRRAQENAAMIGAMKKDMNAIASELKFRVGLQQ